MAAAAAEETGIIMVIMAIMGIKMQTGEEIMEILLHLEITVLLLLHPLVAHQEGMVEVEAEAEVLLEDLPEEAQEAAQEVLEDLGDHQEAHLADRQEVDKVHHLKEGQG